MGGLHAEVTQRGRELSVGQRQLLCLGRALLTQAKVRLVDSRGARFAYKVGQIGPKWEKSGAFSDQISVHFARGRQMH